MAQSSLGSSDSALLSPGFSLNLNKSYAFAQISASGKTSYESTAVTFGLFGWRRTERSNSASTLETAVDEAGLLAAKEASMVDSWAGRDISMLVCGENLLGVGYQALINIFSI